MHGVNDFFNHLYAVFSVKSTNVENYILNQHAKQEKNIPREIVFDFVAEHYTLKKSAEWASSMPTLVTLIN